MHLFIDRGIACFDIKEVDDNCYVRELYINKDEEELFNFEHDGEKLDDCVYISQTTICDSSIIYLVRNFYKEALTVVLENLTRPELKKTIKRCKESPDLMYFVVCTRNMVELRANSTAIVAKDMHSPITCLTPIAQVSREYRVSIACVLCAQKVVNLVTALIYGPLYEHPKTLTWPRCACSLGDNNNISNGSA